MKRYRNIILWLIFALFLRGTVGSGVALALDNNSATHKPTAIEKNMRVAFQERRRPVENSLIKPSENQRSVPEKTYRHNQARDALQSGRIVSLSIIRKRIGQSFPGKIVDVRLLEPAMSNRPYIYLVKVLRQDGKLLMIEINATTAQIISVKGNG
ncbi:MAG: hypothetical protein K9G26_08850 [Emcibacter sp.]|nr:hypothetical protein [Emcibacter sp.]